jgi:hypothetical protein
VQDQQRRVVAVLAPELDPLVDATDLDEALLDDPIRGVDLKCLGHPALARRAPDQPPTAGAAMMPAAPAKALPIMAAS